MVSLERTDLEAIEGVGVEVVDHLEVVGDFRAFVRRLEPLAVFNFEEVGAVRQVENENAAIAGNLCVVEVAQVRVVLLRLVGPLCVTVFFEAKLFSAFNDVVLATDLEDFYSELRVLRSAILTFLLDVHGEGVDMLSIRCQWRGTHASTWSPDLCILVLGGFFLLLFFLSARKLVLRPVESLELGLLAFVFRMLEFGRTCLCRFQRIFVQDDEGLVGET